MPAFTRENTLSRGSRESLSIRQLLTPLEALSWTPPERTRAVIRIVLALPQRRIGSAPGAAIAFVRAMLDRWEGVCERIGRKGLAANCCAGSRQVCALGHIFRALPPGGKLIWKL